MKKKICVFAGSSSGGSEEYSKNAIEVGKLIAELNLDLVYGGGDKGIMGAVSKSASYNGAKTIGVVPQFLIEMDKSTFKDLKDINSTLEITENMHQRKFLMYKKSNAFLVLPGGIGTLDECFEVLTWMQLGLIKNKPLGIINLDGYWDLLIQLIKNIVDKSFMNKNNLLNFQELKDMVSVRNFFSKV